MDAIDNEGTDRNEDIFSIKRHYLTQAITNAIQIFATEWIIFICGPIYARHGPHTKIDSKNYDGYKSVNPDAKPFRYAQDIKREWRERLDETVVPLGNEAPKLLK